MAKRRGGSRPAVRRGGREAGRKGQMLERLQAFFNKKSLYKQLAEGTGLRLGRQGSGRKES